MGSTQFINVRIFAGTSATLEPALVAVPGLRVETVATGSERLSRHGAAEVLDGAGASETPGLVSPHCHFACNDSRSLADLTTLPVNDARFHHRPRSGRALAASKRPRRQRAT